MGKKICVGKKNKLIAWKKLQKCQKTLVKTLRLVRKDQRWDYDPRRKRVFVVSVLVSVSG